jgi:DNA repair protein RadA/Sms
MTTPSRQPARQPAPRARPEVYRCGECGWETGKWVGRCGECQAWGTVDLVGAGRGPRAVAGPVSEPARPIGNVDAGHAGTYPTGIAEFDRVIGGGIVPGGVLLMAGEPGIGKSTLLLAVAAALARKGLRCLYVTAEESAAQVRLRADRIGALSDHLYLAAENDLSALLGQVDAVQPQVLIVDSIQTVGSIESGGTVGGVAQVREVAAALIRLAKARNISTFLVGHVTKDGNVAGPRVLEHLVDVVVYFDGDRHARLRLVRAVKNRYGATDEVGCFDLGDDGINEVPDPSGLFLVRRDIPVPGTCVTVTMEGTRPLVTEVQSLAVSTPEHSSRRMTHGLDANRVAMTIAVLQRSSPSGLSQREIYTSTVGGVRITDTSCDLAVALAVESAASGRPLPADLVVLGELALAGDVRPVTALQRRLTEAARLGFKTAFVPPGLPRSGVPDGLRVLGIASITAAFEALDLHRRGRSRPVPQTPPDGGRARLTPVH